MLPVPVCSVVFADSVVAPASIAPVPSVRPITCCVKPPALEIRACDTWMGPAPPAMPMAVDAVSGVMLSTPLPDTPPAVLSASVCSCRSCAPETLPPKVSDEPVSRVLADSWSAPLKVCAPLVSMLVPARLVAPPPLIVRLVSGAVAPTEAPNEVAPAFSIVSACAPSTAAPKGQAVAGGAAWCAPRVTGAGVGLRADGRGRCRRSSSSDRRPTGLPAPSCCPPRRSAWWGRSPRR